MDSSDLAVRVRTPSRLHFGLLAFGDGAPRQFGGVGVMIERPSCELTVDLVDAPSLKIVPTSKTEKRTWEFFSKFRRSFSSLEQLAFDDRLRVQVVQSIPEHVGLGSGTQLGMAVAKALSIWAGRSDMSPDELARRIGRGARSAIGVHGFNCGGFIVEGGKSDLSRISPLVARHHFPDDWHFVLVIPSDSQGRHGAAEREAFENLAPIPSAATADLCRLTMLGMLPAIAERDLQAFSEALVEFGAKVGQCFSSIQDGVYGSPLAGAVVDLCLRHGIRGVAQSSWGPSLAAVTDSRFRAEWLAARLLDSIGAEHAQLICTPANNSGAKIEVVHAE